MTPVGPCYQREWLCAPPPVYCKCLCNEAELMLLNVQDVVVDKAGKAKDVIVDKTGDAAYKVGDAAKGANRRK